MGMTFARIAPNHGDQNTNAWPLDDMDLPALAPSLLIYNAK
jgi:hypothetical protein